MQGSIKKIGILGFGSLGEYLVGEIERAEDLSLEFVWNQSSHRLSTLPPHLRLHRVEDVASRAVDLVVEVCHPSVTERYLETILAAADYMIGSPTALADEKVLERARAGSVKWNRRIYVPCGAFWAAEDVRRMAESNVLEGLTVTMQKHPKSFKLETPLKEANEAVTLSPLLLYDGPVRELCRLAPKNVNTMAVGAIAGHTLGFDGVRGRLVSDPSLTESHVVEIEVRGRKGFRVDSRRLNPATLGHVTGSLTYSSFYNSLQRIPTHKEPGIHIC